MNMVAAIYCRSCLLPEIVREDTQSGPNRSRCGASRQDTTQTEFAFEHADRSLDSTTKPLQLPEPRFSLMQFFGLAQAALLRDAHFLNAGLPNLQHVFGTVVAPRIL